MNLLHNRPLATAAHAHCQQCMQGPTSVAALQPPRLVASQGLQPAFNAGRAALQPLHNQPVSHPSEHRRLPCKRTAAGSAGSQLVRRQGQSAMFRASLQKAALQLLGVHAVYVIVLSCLPHKVLHSLIEGLHVVLVLSTQDLSKGSLQAVEGM